ncbi:MAG: phosphoribosylformylglycinamidine cyclo-ligase [Candidatus Kapaibacterium sp.]
MDYKAAGVDIAEGDELVRRIKPRVRSTFNSNVLADIGLFGALYDARFPDFTHPVLVSSTDGVGTKLKIAFATDRHDTVGQDLVNHCVNDILACGAKPLFFLDYFATGKLDADVGEKVIEGLVTACAENGCALIGGETAEMPSMYTPGEYDLAGTVVGVVEKSKVLDGSRITSGDVLVGLRSTGLHTNGFSLARKVLFPKYSVDTRVDELGMTIGEALLQVHRSYQNEVYPLLSGDMVKAVSHITGGGIIGNTSRVMPAGLSLAVDWTAWEVLPVFRFIQQTGGIADEAMREAFNLGIGMILVCAEEHADAVLAATSAADPKVIGRVVPA